MSGTTPKCPDHLTRKVPQDQRKQGKRLFRTSDESCNVRHQGYFSVRFFLQNCTSRDTALILSTLRPMTSVLGNSNAIHRPKASATMDPLDALVSVFSTTS